MGQQNDLPKLVENDEGDLVPDDRPVTINGVTHHPDGHTEVQSLDTEELSITDGRGVLGLPTHHLNYASGLSDEEIARFSLKSGDVLELWRLEVQLKGGGNNSNVSLDVYDATNATVLGSVTAGSRSEGGSTPLGVSGAGATIIVRLSTGSNSVDICPTGLTSVVSE